MFRARDDSIACGKICSPFFFCALFELKIQNKQLMTMKKKKDQHDFNYCITRGRVPLFQLSGLSLFDNKAISHVLKCSRLFMIYKPPVPVVQCWAEGNFSPFLLLSPFAEPNPTLLLFIKHFNAKLLLSNSVSHSLSLTHFSWVCLLPSPFLSSV